jgi:transcriptional regulator with XRE-family HTH domain
MMDSKSRGSSEIGNCATVPTADTPPGQMPRQRRDAKKYEAFGKRLRQACDARGVQYTEAGEHVGARPNTMWRWMKGESMPSGERQQAVADYLGVPLRWLLHGGPTPPGIDSDRQPDAAPDPVVSREDARAALDTRMASPAVRAAWSIFMQGMGADQQIRRSIVLGFVDVAELELKTGASIEATAQRAGEWAINALIELHRAELDRPRRPR